MPLRAIVFPACTHGMIAIEKDAHGKRTPRDAYAPGYLTLLADFAKGVPARGYGDARWAGE